MSKRRIDPWTTIVPLGVILILCVFFVATPSRSMEVLGMIRSFLDDEMGVYYLATGLLVFALSLWTAFSDIGSWERERRLGAPAGGRMYRAW